MTSDQSKVALITGAAKRIGAELAHTLHQTGFKILIHYRSSEAEARTLCEALERQRPNSAHCIAADLSDAQAINGLAQQALAVWDRVDVLINNASAFYPTKIKQITPEDWDQLINTNLRAPLFLSQALSDSLKQQGGCIINLVDIHAERPLKGFSLYSISKAAVAMLTKSLALEFGPEIRVNGISPGAILWPEQDAELNQKAKASLLDRTALKREGKPQDICETALFLITRAPYITGQIISVDGGRTLNQ